MKQELKEQNQNDIYELSKRYKAYFIGVTDKDKHEFKNSKSIMLISVGQKYHEEGEFLAAVNLVNKSFHECNILVCDTLQRHSPLKSSFYDKSEEELYALTKHAGDEWISRNMKYITNFNIPYTISRWDEWVNNGSYSYYYKSVCLLYENDAEYQNIVHEIVHKFLARRDPSDIKNFDLAFQKCIRYLLEESAIACLWIKRGYPFCVYPTGANSAMVMAQKKLLSDEDIVGTKSLALNIKKFLPNHLKHRHKDGYNSIALEYILSHAPGHIYWKSRDGVFLGCNDEHARYFGFDQPSEIIGKVNADFLDENTASTLSDIDSKVMNSGRELIVEECVNGTQYFFTKKIPIRDQNNNVVGILGTSVDITEKKNLEIDLKHSVEKLKHSLETKERFIRNVNHEIRIPMQLILNASQILKDNFRTTTDEEKLYFLDGMISATRRLNDLVTNLLDLSKFKEGRFSLNPGRENVETLMQEVIKEFYVLENRVSHKIRDNVSTHILCDKLRIQQVLRNLIMNSVRYSEKDTPILIVLSNYVEAGRKYCKFSVQDRGYGIPEEEKDKIFEPFFESSRTKEMSTGVGLGLSIAKEIVESHQGKIWIENQNEKQISTTVSFIVPVAF